MKARSQYWRQLGRIFHQSSNLGWARTHASYPTISPAKNGVLKIYFSTRDGDQRSSAASVEIYLDSDKWELASDIQGPHLSAGPRGAFDADGVTFSCLVPYNEQLFAFYLGWTVLRDVPFTNFIGLAVSSDDGYTFTRVSPAPVLGRSRENPFTVGYPFVMRDRDAWRMWFGSHMYWGERGLEMLHVLKEATSYDLENWSPSPRVVLNVAGAADPAEFAISRPWVIRERDGAYSMWYARRKPGYVLGYATSQDGATWRRCDEAVNFTKPPELWESGERTYPCVFDHAGRRYMLYNGNGYGREGFGLAILED